MAMLTRIILFISILTTLSHLHLNAQTDTEFWFAAPDITQYHGTNGTPLYLHITAINSTTVEISRPADTSWSTIIFAMEAGETISTRLDSLPEPYTLTLEDIENHPGAVQNNGFKIESYPGEITVIYEPTNEINKDLFSLKGQNALGKEFTVTTQNVFDNWTTNDAWAGFILVATESNTSVTVHLNSDYKGHPSGTHVITLPNAGDTYVFESATQLAANHPQGEKVISDKAIAITIYDDSMDKNSAYGSGSCKDIIGDQIVPEELLGFEYLVLKGQLSSRSELVFITGTQDNTSVVIKDDFGSVLADTLINDGEVFLYEIENRLTYVVGDEPISVHHITGFGCEQGSAILPPIDYCTGSNEVTIARSYPADNSLYLNVMVRNDTVEGSAYKNQAVNHFTISVGAIDTAIPAEYFAYTSDSVFAYLIDDGWPGTINSFINSIIPAPSPDTSTTPPTVATIKNPLVRFHLGVLQGNGTGGCKYGYFSDYNSGPFTAGVGGASGPTITDLCEIAEFQLVADGGSNYLWECSSHPELTDSISDLTVSSPYFNPPAEGDYQFKVTISGECALDTTFILESSIRATPVPEFELSIDEGCSPITTTLTNTTDVTFVSNMYWIFDSTDEIISQDTIANVFERTFTNETDVNTIRSIKLIAYNDMNCADSITKTVDLFAIPVANFSLEDSTICPPHETTFANNSIGVSPSYVWSINDSISYAYEPEYNFTNDADIILYKTIELIATSVNDCIDSMSKSVSIYPMPSGSIETDTDTSCSPLTAEINVLNVLNSDSIIWTVNYPDITELISTGIEAIPLNYTNNLDATDSVLVSSGFVSNYGCTAFSDTLKFTVLPEVISDFNFSPQEGTSPLEVSFTDLSSLTETYLWDFGDSTTSIDVNPTHIYESNTSQEFIVSLTIHHEGCQDIKYDTIYLIPELVNTVAKINPSKVWYYYNQYSECLDIRSEVELSSDLNISIYSTLGTIVAHNTLNLSSGNNTLSLSLAEEKSGVYIVRMQIDEKLIVGKFIKN